MTAGCAWSRTVDEPAEGGGHGVAKLHHQLTMVKVSREHWLAGRLDQGSMIQTLRRQNRRQRHSEHLRNLISKNGPRPSSSVEFRVLGEG